MIHPAVWKGQSLHQSGSSSGISSSFRLLDRELPGNGWPRGSLTELLVQHMGIGELRFLAPTLRSLTQAGQHIVLLAPPHTPYAPAFEAMGIDHQKILVVQADRPIDKLWAVEQSIKSNQFGALITWLDHQGGTRPELIRRLQLAASTTQGLVFVFRPFAAQDHPSPAPLRMLLLPRRYPDLAVQIIKRRGPVMSAPIDIAIPVPGSGLRSLQDHDAIIAAPSAAPTRQTAHHHAVDRMHSSPSLPGSLSPAAASRRSPAHR